MKLDSRTVISHLAVLAVGLGVGIYLVRANSPSAPPPETPAPAADGQTEAPAAGTKTAAKEQGGKTAANSENAGDSKLINQRQAFSEQLNKGEFRQALLILQEMEKSAPATRAYLESNSEYLVAMREWDALKTAAKKCIAAFPQSRICLRHLANAEIQTGTKEDQMATVNACLAVEPNDPDCRHLSGMALMNTGDFSGAVSVYERLIRDNGSYGVRFPEDMLEMQLGLALDGAGRPEEAINHLENSCRLNNEQACQKIEEISGGGYD